MNKRMLIPNGSRNPRNGALRILASAHLRAQHLHIYSDFTASRTSALAVTRARSRSRSRARARGHGHARALAVTLARSASRTSAVTVMRARARAQKLRRNALETVREHIQSHLFLPEQPSQQPRCPCN